jgi:hypothetical protein
MQSNITAFSHYFMTFLDFCSLCGAPAGPKYARRTQDSWRGHTQELYMDQTGEMVGSRHPQFPVLHRSCWAVVERMVTTVERYDTCWLKEFRDCLRNLSPLLRQSQPEAAPELLTEELGTILASPLDHSPNVASTIPSPNLLLSLPAELLHVVYSFLTEFSDVHHLRTATGRDPPVATWKSLWRKYDVWQLEPCSDEQFRDTAEHVLRKLELRSSEHPLWPHAATVATVWKNCELVLKLYRQRQYGSISDHDERQLLVHSSDSQCHNQTLRMQDFEFRASSTLTMNFVDVYDRRYICGMEFNGYTIGYKGDRSVASGVKSWTGLRLISDGLGFVSFQFRDISAWQDVNPVYRFHNPGPESRYCEVIWDKGSVRGILVLSLDVGSSLFTSCSVKANWVDVQSQRVGHDPIKAI